jgi:hypothetical protein
VSKTLKLLFSPKATKAWLAGAGALISALLMGNQDGILDLDDYLIAAGAFIGSVGVVFGVPNAKDDDVE